MKKSVKNVKLYGNFIAKLETKEKNKVILDMSKALKTNYKTILKSNTIDMQHAHEQNLNKSLKDRLFLDKARVYAMADALEEIANLPDPVGKVLEENIFENSLTCKKVSVPLGVVAIIYESRPNVTSDTVGLCLKSGNACVLKGGKEARESNLAIIRILQNVLEKNNLPKESIAYIDAPREEVAKLLKMDKHIDVVIPRGGESLVKFVTTNSLIPVIKHDKGLCHTYIDKDANISKALAISINAKCQRTGVCNAMETLLVHEKIAPTILPLLKKEFDKHNTHLKGCKKTIEIIAIKKATKEDFATEYLANILSIKVVKNCTKAIEHIREYGSGHSEAIITENRTTAENFLNNIDASCVYHNASTRFTDGGVFGFGAEIGISTNKLHVRGPVGVSALTTYKYKVYGNGQIRD